MPTTTKRASLEISPEDLAHLAHISHSRTLPKREVDRAKILILYSKNRSINLSSLIAPAIPAEEVKPVLFLRGRKGLSPF
jgi:hypothetical protein